MTDESDRTTPDETAEEAAGPTGPVQARKVTLRPASVRRATALPVAPVGTVPELTVTSPQPTASAVAGNPTAGQTHHLAQRPLPGAAGQADEEGSGEPKINETSGNNQGAATRAAPSAASSVPLDTGDDRSGKDRVAVEGADPGTSRLPARVVVLLRDRRVVSAAVAGTALLLAGIPLLAINGPSSGGHRAQTVPAGVAVGDLPAIPHYPPVTRSPSPSVDVSVSDDDLVAPPRASESVGNATRPAARDVVAANGGTNGAPKGDGSSMGGAATMRGTDAAPARSTPAPAPTRTTASAPVKSTAPAPAAAGGPDYDAITGLGCIRDSTQGYYTQGQSLSGWRTASTGGFGGYGCSGRYESMPLNGTNSHTDNRYMVWWFDTNKVSAARCDLWIFVPKAADSADTASTAYFAVIPSKTSTKTLGTFSVNESATRSSWAYGGKWTMSDGRLAVKLLDRGAGRASAAAALVKCYR